MYGLVGHGNWQKTGTQLHSKQPKLLSIDELSCLQMQLAYVDAPKLPLLYVAVYESANSPSHKLVTATLCTHPFYRIWLHDNMQCDYLCHGIHRLACMGTVCTLHLVKGTSLSPLCAGCGRHGHLWAAHHLLHCSQGCAWLPRIFAAR